MTDLTKRVKRRSISFHRGRRIVVSLYPGDVLGFREERTRKEFILSIEGAYVYAVKLAVIAKRMAKAAERRRS